MTLRVETVGEGTRPDTAPSPRLKIGILGSGRMGGVHASHARRHHGLTLAAVADPMAARADELAGALGVPAYRRWEDVVDDPQIEAVVIASPAYVHAEQVVAACAAGKHVFCEKPLALTLDDAAAAVAAASTAGVVLHVGFQRRHDVAFRELRDELASGRIGEPWVVRICSRDREPPPAGYGSTSGSLFVDMSIHDFDMARFLLGQEVTEVSSVTAALASGARSDRAAVDTAVTTLVFGSGALGVVENCRQSAHGYDQRVEIHGRDGTLAVENAPSHALVVADSLGSRRGVWPNSFTDRYSVAYALEIDAFAREALRRSRPAEGGETPVDPGSVADDTTVAATGEDAMRALAIALAAELSTTEHCPVQVST